MMVVLIQIAIGTGLLLACALVHILVVVSSIPVLQRIARHYPDKQMLRRNFAVFGATVLTLLFAHTLQIWAWAALFWVADEFPDFGTSFYFSTVTYTTLGYGDVVLETPMRFVATFAAVTGLLTFGISTAVLVGVLGRMLPDDIRRKPGS
ncbi:MAG: potassium channel family protein [Pseudomonadota bacterium]